MSAQVSNLVPVLHEAVVSENLDLVVSICDQILKLSPEDVDAIDCKAIAMLQKEDFSAVCEVINNHKNVRLDFLKAYALYRNKEDIKLLDHLSNLDEKTADEHVLHLHGQTLYRQKQYSEAKAYYKSMLDNNNDDQEILTNYLASTVASGLIGDDTVNDNIINNLNSIESESYELEYNKACVLIAQKKYKHAYDVLIKAQIMCKESLIEDNSSDMEIKDEMCLFKVQLAYCQQHMGNNDTARKIYEEIITDKPSDTTVLATASNNLISLRGKHEKLFISLNSSLKAWQVDHSKITMQQEKVFLYNRLLLLIMSKHFDEANELLLTVEKNNINDNDIDNIILKAVLAYEKNDISLAKKILLDYIHQNNNDNDEIANSKAQLYLTHIYLLNNELKEASDVLQTSKVLLYRPAWVAVLVSLYERAGDTLSASTLLDKALTYWEKKDTSSAAFACLAEKSIRYKLEQGDFLEAVKLYEHITTKDDSLLAKLVLSLSKGNADSDMIMKYASMLPQIKETSEDSIINDDEIDNLSLPARRRKEKPISVESKEEKENKKTMKKKKKKIRYPKGFDSSNPGNMPDPERWLPLWQRTRTKDGKKIKKKKNQSFKGAQGGGS